MTLALDNKSAGLSGALFFAALLTPVASVAGAVEPASLKAEIGVSAMSFKYQEFSGSGNVLDREQGYIPGLSFVLGQRVSAWEWDAVASYHRGRVDYIGQTNLGTPYNTRTDERISDVALRAGRWFGAKHPLMLYGGLGYRRWDRDILPGTIGGLFESYRWNYLWLGTKFVALEQSKSQLMLDVGLLKPLDPQLLVDFEGTNMLHPESKIGLRVMLTSNIMLAENTRLVLEPYFEYWELGRSPIVVTSGGTSLYEPASKTNNIGFNLRVGRVF